MIKNKEQLEKLIKEYKIHKTDIIFNQIYKILLPTVKQKADFIYYHKWYPFNLYNSCNKCRNCNKLNNVPKSEHNLICKECKVCKCKSIERGFFNLNNNGLCGYKDVFNDIWMEIVRIIDNYDITQDFSKYLFSNLWEWIPSFLTKDFIKSVYYKSLTQEDKEGNETQIDISDEKEKPKLSLEEILNVTKTKREKELINLFLNDNTMTQEKAGEKLRISQQAISLIFNKLQKRLKKYL